VLRSSGRRQVSRVSGPLVEVMGRNNVSRQGVPPKFSLGAWRVRWRFAINKDFLNELTQRITIKIGLFGA
jgi:hypothetical protein